MFPFQRSCELSFKVDNEDNPSEQDIEDEILLGNNALFGVSNTINSDRGRGRGRGRSRGRRSVSLGSSSNTNNINDDEEEKKRVFHREIERQRRMEMSSLFDSLRSVIPPNDSKGRKSITDQLEEATNYIKDLEKNVKELGDKRDQLKQSIQSSSSGRYELGGSSGSSPPYTVAIRQFVGGLEIEISVKYDENEFLLSTAIQVALEEGLDVVSSTSAKFHERFIHSIQCEIIDVTCIDLNRLEQRLNDLFRRPGDDQ
ncbi:transcription factor bHLH36-like [Silene latifolia]|uniref:transcription factor bHLH36-like n=1 Tax=Silene latifolia TaxID=37657 RepID=UPI003D76E918